MLNRSEKWQTAFKLIRVVSDGVQARDPAHAVLRLQARRILGRLGVALRKAKALEEAFLLLQEFGLSSLTDIFYLLVILISVNAH